METLIESVVFSAGFLLVSPVLCVGLGSACRSLCQLLEVVCGSWSGFPAGEDCGSGCVPYGGSLHRGGGPATVQGAEHKLCQRHSTSSCEEIRLYKCS